MLVNVIDFEATCWLGPPPEGTYNEIIEWGVCVVDTRKREIVKVESLATIPQFNGCSDFCTRLTGWTDQKLKDAGGRPLDERCQTVKKEFGSLNRPWLSWGNYDRNQLVGECNSKGIEYPMSQEHFNLKTLFKMMTGQKLGVKRALDHYEMTFDGRPHSGVDDAKNIGRILCEMLRRHERVMPQILNL